MYNTRERDSNPKKRFTSNALMGKNNNLRNADPEPRASKIQDLYDENHKRPIGAGPRSLPEVVYLFFYNKLELLMRKTFSVMSIIRLPNTHTVGCVTCP